MQVSFAGYSKGAFPAKSFGTPYVRYQTYANSNAC
jgi:hypothetical protein